MADITISNEKLEEILIEVGVPILEISDLPYTETQIRTSFIYPAMREYFKFFPIEDQIEYSIGTSFEIPFPDTDTFNVSDVRLITNIASGGQTADPFVNSLNVLSVGKSSGRYGTQYDYNLSKTYGMERASMSANINSQMAFKYKVDKVNRVIKGFSNVAGKIAVTWAKMSLDYDDIPFSAEMEVQQLASSNLLRGWGGLISMQSSTSESDLDPGYFMDRSQELRDEVYKKWTGFTKAVVLR